MLQESEIKVINNSINLLPTYKTNIIPELLQDKLEQIIPRENSQGKSDRFISNIKLIENFIIIISTKTSKNLSELNSIKILGFEISIIKLNLNPGEEKQEINITIPLKEPKVITNKNLSVQKYFFSDFIKVSENKSYFHICVFDQLHIYKIYIKDNQLKYNKIELKKFNEKTKILYLGECFNKDENMVEIDLLLKPLNNLMVLEINADDNKMQKIEEKIYEFKNIQNNEYNNKNIFHKYLRSFCGKFLFTEKETDKKYLIYRDNNDMVIKHVNLDILEKNNIGNNNYINFLYTFEKELYLLAELPKENEDEDRYIILGIFNLIYNEEKDIYESILTQKILINNEGRNNSYFININMDNDISIQTSESLTYIQLGKNSSVEKIYKINTNAKELQISKINCVKFDQWLILLSFIKEDIYVSKLKKDDLNYVEKNCISNYEGKQNMKDNEKVDKENEIKEQDVDNNNKINNEQDIINSKDEKYSNEILGTITIKLNNYIDKIINDRIEQNYLKIESIKQEYENKLELIEQDILAQKKENEKLEKSLDEILNKIGEFDGSNKENILTNENIINNDLNNMKNWNEMMKTKNEMNNFLPFIRRFNTMKMMYPYNFFGAENMLKNQMAMNDPRFAQFLQNGFMNQGNIFHK